MFISQKSPVLFLWLFIKHLNLVVNKAESYQKRHEDHLNYDEAHKRVLILTIFEHLLYITSKTSNYRSLFDHFH